MAIKFKFKPKQFFGLDVFGDRVNKNLRKSLFEIGLLVRSTAVQNIQRGGPRSGAPRPGGGKRSAKGEYPKTDKGRLAQSFLVVPVGSKKVSVGVHGNVRYALYLEKGTRFMKPRPFLLPSFEKNKRPITRLIENGIRNSI